MDKSLPLVSVIIPAYNAASYIQETIESVLEQTWENKEIIVINDGSTDETEQILDRYLRNITYVYQTNRGRGAVRNTGIRIAKGDYIAFLDADDLWEKGFLELHVQSLCKTPEIGISYSWWSYIDQDGYLLPEKGIYTESGDLFSQLIMNNRFPVMAALVRRSVFEKIGEFDGNLLATEDWDLWLRAAAAGFSFLCIPADLARYRIHKSNFTYNSLTMHTGQLHVLGKIFSLPNLPIHISQKQEMAYGRVYLTTTAQFYFSNKDEQALSTFQAGVNIWPDLLIDEDTYYVLICSQQPPGYRNTSDFKDLNLAESRITCLLDTVFAMPDLSPEIARLESRAKATARLALAHHYYLEGKNKQARRLIAAAAKLNLPAVSNQKVASSWLKSILGYKRIQTLKQLIKRT